ncbi:MAG: helix-turn-helix domain-containing protein [Ilumatobacteraceae bacterium]
MNVDTVVDGPMSMVDLSRRRDELLARHLVRLASCNVTSGRRALARFQLGRALEITDGADEDGTVSCALSLLARLDLDEGRWDEALAAAALLAGNGHADEPRTDGLVVTALVRARRGENGVWAPLEDAWHFAAASGDVARIEQVAAARAEAAWLEGRSNRARRTIDDAVALGVSATAATVRYWQWRSGASACIGVDPANPQTMEMAGRWRDAVAAWDAMGFTYSAAVARLDGDDDDALLRALSVLRGLGARPVQTMVEDRLRRRGVTLDAPSPAASDMAPGLSRRERDVLELVAAGCSNRAIARRLYISPHTAANHVRAILRKTDTTNRTAAAAVYHAEHRPHRVLTTV